MRNTCGSTSPRVGGLVALAALVVPAWPGTLAAVQDRPLAADFPEVYRVGGFDAPEWAEFTGSPRLNFDGAGRLYALDASAGHVVVIDQSGSLVRIVGRPGEGPGEFDQPGAFVVWPDGRLAVADIGHNAYQVFGPDGVFERFVRMGSGSDVFGGISNMRVDLRPDPVGLAIVARGLPSRMGAFTDLLGEMVGAEATEEGVDDRGLERLDLGGDEVVAEAILEAWRPSTGEDESERKLSLEDLAEPTGMLGVMVGDVRWFEPTLRWDLLPDGGIAYSDSSAYDIRLTDRVGRVTGTLGRPLAPERVTRRVRSAVRENALRDLEEGQGDGMLAGLVAGAARMSPELADQWREAAREEIARREFFEEIPVLSALRATWDGTLWIQRRGEEPWDASGPIDVMRPGGEYVGTFAAGATRMPAAFGPNGLIAFIELDELDIPSIVVRRVPAEVR